MIPEAAVEAAAKKLAFLNSDAGDQLTDREWARELIEAATPHILAGLRELVEDMERQPPSEMATVPGIAVLIRAAVGDAL